jgi:2-polyprenyl-3-methyl-5-hydroxy-6-metoxy-1,4-benzoquinol methylase
MSANGYAYKPFPGSSHRWAIDQARALPMGALRVLDVGAGTGEVLAAIAEARPSLVEAWAVEPANTGAAIRNATWSRHLAQVDCDDFDLALLLDVLEHIEKPRQTLEAVAERVRPGGTFLISVPNVTHWSVRASLLAGNFDYADRGILDRTHLRFFTKKSLLQLVRRAGLEVESTSEALVPLELLLPGVVTKTLAWGAATGVRRLVARAWPTLLAYQLLVRARKA